jgi:peptide deformylase
VTERPLRVLGDPVLRTPGDPVVRFDDALARLVRGELARCLQHETDYRRGELFIDRLVPSVRGAVMPKIANLA